MDEELRERSHIQTFDQFYLFEGREIFDFVNQTILKNASPICQLENYKTAIYRAPNGGNFLCLSEGNDIDRTAQITELLTPWLTAARRVFAFSFQPAYSYNTTRDFDKQCFIRSLCSSTNSDFGLSFVEPMEDCNLIHGVVAGGECSSMGIDRMKQMILRDSLLQFQLGVFEAKPNLTVMQFTLIVQQLIQPWLYRFFSSSKSVA